MVAAAGNRGRDKSNKNDGYLTIDSPGNDPYVITVGAMNTKDTNPRADDVMTSYSSKGPTLVDHIVKPDLVAPGNRIASTLAEGSTLAFCLGDDPRSAAELEHWGGAPGLRVRSRHHGADAESGTAPLRLAAMRHPGSRCAEAGPSN